MEKIFLVISNFSYASANSYSYKVPINSKSKGITQIENLICYFNLIFSVVRA